MKLQALTALSVISLSLLAGCAAPQAVAPSPPPDAAAPVASSPALPASVPGGGPQPIVIDLAKQAMIIPGTQFGTTNIPILAGGDVLAGSSVITAEPDGVIPFVHCEDRTAAWATEPNTQGAGSWARPLQLVTFDPACPDVASISGHAIVVPRAVTADEPGTIDQWLSEGREVVVVGESPYPDPNKEPMTHGKIEWPDDRAVHLRSFDYEG